MKTLALALVSSLGLVACNGPAAEPANQSASTNQGKETLAGGPVLHPQGLQLMVDGQTRLIAFGTPMAELGAQLNEATGLAGEESVKDMACRTTSWAREDGPYILDIYSRDGQFVGYHGGPGHRTAQGIGFGSTRAELDAAYDVQVSPANAQGQLPFTANGLRGVLEEDGPGGSVVAIMAGEECGG
jgi:hypothetical protein